MEPKRPKRSSQISSFPKCWSSTKFCYISFVSNFLSWALRCRVGTPFAFPNQIIFWTDSNLISFKTCQNYRRNYTEYENWQSIEAIEGYRLSKKTKYILWKSSFSRTLKFEVNYWVTILSDQTGTRQRSTKSWLRLNGINSNDILMRESNTFNDFHSARLLRLEIIWDCENERFSSTLNSRKLSHSLMLIRCEYQEEKCNARCEKIT